MAEARDMTERRRRLLAQTLRHAPFDGWTMTALEAGARDLGLGLADALLLVPGGLGELAAFHHAEADRLMLKALGAQDLSGLKIRERVALAVRLRLEPHAKDREAIRRVLGFLAQPQNAPLALRCLYRTVDAVWHAIGDRSTDFNFYTKRGLLAGGLRRDRALLARGQVGRPGRDLAVPRPAHRRRDEGAARDGAARQARRAAARSVAAHPHAAARARRRLDCLLPRRSRAMSQVRFAPRSGRGSGWRMNPLSPQSGEREVPE